MHLRARRIFAVLAPGSVVSPGEPDWERLLHACSSCRCHRAPVGAFPSQWGGEYGDIRKVAVAEDNRGSFDVPAGLEQNPGEIIDDSVNGGPGRSQVRPVADAGLAGDNKPVKCLR